MQSDTRKIRRASAIVLAGLATVVLLLLVVGQARASFGLAGFDGQWTSSPAGEAFTQAGGHPYDVTTEIALNQHEDPLFGAPAPDAQAKDIFTSLPAGLIGNPTAASACPTSQLVPAVNGGPIPQCSLSSQVGIVTLHTAGYEISLPVFNLQVPPTVAARFGFNLLGVDVVLDASVRSNGDYGIDINSRDISEALPLVGLSLTIWGVPADHSHDGDRCLIYHLGATSPLCAGPAGNSLVGPNEAGISPVPFMTLPTRCTAAGQGLETSIRVDSWNEPGVFQQASFFTHESPNFPTPPGERGAQVGVTGCERVPFDPSIHVTPTASAPGSPSGLGVSLSLPADGVLNPTGLAQSELRKATVTLPEGMAVNPSSAAGLGACSSAQIDLASTAEAACPQSSKIGTVSIETPLLQKPLEGSLFLAAQNDNPFGSLLALYIVAKGPGLILKLPGRVDTDPATGQLTTTFDNLPQLPLSNLQMTLKDGPRAPLVAPSSCGDKTIASELVGWSGKTVTLSDAYTVECPPGLGGFAPALQAGTTNSHAGGFSPFSLTLNRADGEQELGSVSLRMPPGLLGVIDGVGRCPEPQASQGACGADSLIGHTTVGAGAGSNPFYLGGSVYLTGPYKSAPFGLSIVVPAVAGPFNLGNVVVRAQILVDPHTAQLTVVSDPLPRILQGIPLDLRVVNVTVDREGFTFNPTDCQPLLIDATIGSQQGASVGVSNRFQAADCASLAFRPSFKVSTQAATSRARGASLDVKVASGAGQANIGRVAVKLPEQLPSRLTTIRQACPEATFAANPGSCPEGSDVGTATATTPILASVLSGPAYLVSHGGAAFPDLVIVLQGEGVTVDLVGGIDIKGQITSSTFANVPDVPIDSFELKLPEGPHSALAANGNLCRANLVMPTAFVAQNGATLDQDTRIEVEGCPNALGVVLRSISRRTLRLSVYVPGAGRLTASGKGVGRASKTSSGREAVKLTLYAARSGRFSTKVKLSFAPARSQVESRRSTGGNRQTKVLTVTFAK